MEPGNSKQRRIGNDICIVAGLGSRFGNQLHEETTLEEDDTIRKGKAIVAATTLSKARNIKVEDVLGLLMFTLTAQSLNQAYIWNREVFFLITHLCYGQILIHWKFKIV